jgi:hypothetical protein
MSRRVTSFTPEFVDSFPTVDYMTPGVLYISMKYGMASHRCACGCGNEVTTKFSRIDWKLEYDGESVSLYPSIGNWGFPCQSHYWIRGNHVQWAPKWTRAQIEAERRSDLARKRAAFGEVSAPQIPADPNRAEERGSFWAAVRRWFGG